MKNRYQEHLKRSAKHYHRNARNANFIKGLLQFDLCDSRNSSTLSWWDDVEFILNNYRVIVTWVHPRLKFLDQIESEAHKRSIHLDSNSDDFIKDTTPNYFKVGRSRKKISTYSVKLTESNTEWNAAYKQSFDGIESTNQYQAKPYIHSKWIKSGRYVEICAPIEVRDIGDLIKLVTLVKKLLKREVMIHTEFPNYVYTKDQWLSEGHDVS